MSKKTIVLHGCIVGLSVLLCGFAVMFSLWNILDTPEYLKGLFDYRAATIGDAICLPILVGTFFVYTKLNKTISKKEKRICIGISGVMAWIGLAMQASWLISNETKLNWSIPIQHHFNIAGWYHSIFFVVMFGVIAYYFTNLWFIFRAKNDSYTWFEKVVLTLVIAAGSTFIYMFLYDDYSSVISVAYLFSGGAICMSSLLLLFIKTATKRCDKDLLFVIMMGEIIAYGSSLMICSDGLSKILF